MTSVPGVFAAGDAVTGTLSVINAIAGARAAAERIDSFLGGDGKIGEVLAPMRQNDPLLGKIDGFGKLERSESSVLPPDERIHCFDAMDLGLSAEQASCEACLARSAR